MIQGLPNEGIFINTYNLQVNQLMASTFFLPFLSTCRFPDRLSTRWLRLRGATVLGDDADDDDADGLWCSGVTRPNKPPK